MSDNPSATVTQSLVAEIVSSYVKNNEIAPADMPTLINTVYQSLASGRSVVIRACVRDDALRLRADQ